MNKPKGGAMSKQEGDGATRIYGAKSNEGKVVNKQKKIDLCIFIKLQITLKEFLSYATTT